MWKVMLREGIGRVILVNIDRFRSVGRQIDKDLSPSLFFSSLSQEIDTQMNKQIETSRQKKERARWKKDANEKEKEKEMEKENERERERDQK